jgi:hypothetical protein
LPQSFYLCFSPVFLTMSGACDGVELMGAVHFAMVGAGGGSWACFNTPVVLIARSGVKRFMLSTVS